ncbi:MAG TPA: hypothetical protein VMC85_15725 [Desulfomonilaceae bacterium]|nr:hypothetical protein [Desulfomonilaceae bacterium]
MRIRELVNVLRSYDPELEILINHEEDLWSVEQTSLREATLHSTSNGPMVESEQYNQAIDGAITGTTNVLLIDVDL